jgi:P2 family phage contractile tail tube protein
MAIASKYLKSWSAFIDGKGFAGNCKEVSLPTLTIKTEDFMAGGMDSPIAIDMGLEKLEASVTLTSYDISALQQWGLGEGQEVPLVVKGSLESFDGSVEAINVSMRGKVVSLEMSAWTAGAESTLKLTMNVHAYRYEQAGQIIFDIDVVNMVRVINGKDVLADRRAALGMDSSNSILSTVAISNPLANVRNRITNGINSLLG